MDAGFFEDGPRRAAGDDTGTRSGRLEQDTTGAFEVTDDKSGAKETFSRINDLRESYEAAVLVVSETTPDGKASSAKTSPLKIEYWDYWRDVDIGGGNTAKEFLFVELNSDTGWFQIWRGREFFN